MLFLTGLLALLALANAGGDHHIKGGGHIKGGDSQHSGSAQQQVIQEAIAPSPYSFNIDTSASYGAKIIREETGDAEGRVKVGSAPVLIPIPAENAYINTPSGIKSVSSAGSTLRKTGFAGPGALFRDPIALPVANQPAITAVKTVKTLTSASGAQTIKTVDKSIQPVVIVTEKKTQPAKVTPVRKGGGDTLPGSLGSSGQKIGGAREVIVYDDGTIVDIGSVSGSAGSSNLQPLLGGISRGPILKAGGQLAGGAKEVIVYEDGTIEEVGVAGNFGQGATKSTVYSGEKAKDVPSLTTVPKSTIRTGPKPDLKIQRRPAATIARPGSGTPVVPAPKPIVPVQTIQSGSLGDNIKQINRQLIQRQNNEGVLQTFGGVAKSESDLAGLSVSLDQLGDYGAIRPIAPAIQLKKQASLPKPKIPTPSITSAANRGESFKYTGSRVTSGILGPSAPRVLPGQIRVVQTLGYNNQFVLGNAAGLSGSSDDIKLINRQLIQRQNNEGVLQTFGSVAKSESDLTGLSVSLEQLGGYGARRPVAPAIQLRQPVTLTKPKVPKPSVTSAANRGQNFKYTGTRVTSGILGSSAPFFIPGQTRVTQAQGYNNQFFVGNAAGSGDDIKLINRQLIQRQNEEGVLQAFGGVVKSESDLTGFPVSLEQLGAYGVNRPISPAIQLRKPVEIAKPKPSKPAAASTAGRDQTYKYTRNQITSGILGSSFPRVIPGQYTGSISRITGYNNQFAVGNAAGPINFNDEIKVINRQLIQRQNEEGILQTFGGVVKSEADLTGLPVSLEQFGGYGGNQPISPAIQLRQPVSITKPRQPNRITPSTASRDQIFKQISPIKPNIPSQSLPQSGLSDNLKLINQQLIQKQANEGFSQTFGGIVKSDSDIGRVSITADQLRGLSQLSGYKANKPVLPSSQSGGGVGIITTADKKLKYASPLPASVATPARVASVPKPKAPAQILPQSYDIITMNRDLIQKQNEQGVLQAFGGIAKSEGDLDGISVSLEQLGGLSQIGGYGANIPQAPQAPKLPVNVAPKRPSITSSQALRQPTATRIDQSAQEMGIRTSGVQSFAPARISPQNALTASRTSSGNQRTATRTSSNISSAPAGGNAAQVSGTSSGFGSSVAGQATYSQGGVNDNLVNINRQLIEKQNREGIQQAFGGIIKSEADLEDGLVYVDELDAITKLVGYNTAGDQGPQSYGYSSPGQRGGQNQAQEAGISFSPIEQSRTATGRIPAGSPDIQIANQEDGGQLQVKIDDIAEPSSLLRGKDSSNIPGIQSLISETFKQTDMQENIPVEIQQSYVPPMRPYNYRTQIRASSSDSPNVQEQQKIEQIFV